MVSLLIKFNGRIVKYTGFMDKNISIGVRHKQFAKLRKLKFYNFCPTEAIELKFLSDRAY